MTQWLLNHRFFDARFMFFFHVALTVVWCIALVAMFFAPNSLKQSVTVVIAISIYANVGAHFSSAQAALADLRSPNSEEFGGQVGT